MRFSKIAFATCVQLMAFVNLYAQKHTIFYDNSGGSVVDYFHKVELGRMLTENYMSLISTVDFTVDRTGKVSKVTNLLNTDDLAFDAVKKALERSSGSWEIKPGRAEQSFQITFVIVPSKTDSVIKVNPNNNQIFLKLNRSFINYNGAPKELTILPTIYIVYKEPILKVERVQ